MQDLLERVKDCARGAALMTGTQVEIEVLSAVSNLLPNLPLEKAMRAAMERLGPPEWDEADRDFARKIQATLSDGDIRNAYRRAGIPPRRDQPLHDALVPLDARPSPMIGSTDVGDVSWVVPTVQAHAATYAIGTPGHSWQLTAQGKTPAAHKGMIFVAKAMAATGVSALQSPRLIADAQADLAARTAETPYVCPIPPEVEPPIKAMGLAAV
jgi:aminobenzoyl-glutamate utilization protein B